MAPPHFATPAGVANRVETHGFRPNSCTTLASYPSARGYVMA